MSERFAGFHLRRVHGVPVLWKRDERFKTFRVVFHARRPLDRRAAARSLLPALLLQGTERDPDRPALARRMESLYGAGVAPSSGKHGECHVLRLTLDAVAGRCLPGRPDQLGAGLGFLLDYLVRPRREGDGFPRAAFERERAMAVDAARGLVDDRASHAAQRALETACAGEPMAIPEHGGIADLERLTPAEPELARQDFLVHGEAWLIGFGALDEPFERHAEAFLAGLPARAVEPVPPPVAIAPRGVQHVVERVELRQSRLVLVFRFVPSLDPAVWVARRLFVSMLGGGSHSRLFREVREKRSLAYYASAVADRHKGLLVVHVGLDEAAAPTVEAETRRQVEELSAGRFTDDELATARAGVLSLLEALGDSAFKTCEFVAEQWLLGADRTPEDLAALYARAGRDAIVAASAGTWLDTVFLLADTVHGGPQ